MDRGGAETFIMNNYRKIDRSLFQFDFVVHSNSEGSFDKEIKSLGGNIYTFPKFNGMNYINYKICWEKFLKKHPEYQIIHGHMNSTSNIYMKIGKDLGRNVISHAHSTSNGSGIIGKIKDYTSKGAMKYSDLKLACSIEAGRWLYKDDENFIFLENGIDVEKFAYNKIVRDKYRGMLGVAESTIVLSHVGNFYPVKNHEFLIDTLEKILIKKKDVVLCLFGKGETESKIKSIVKQKNMENHVMFMGAQDNISEWLNAMDLFLMPSLYEGLSVALVEAQTNGLPCIISDNIGKMNQVTDLVSFKKNDSESWCESILTQKCNENRIKYSDIVSKSGFGIENVQNKLTNLYLELLR
ncbi:hypothetical protein AX758_12325 [Enterococcus mundtii]|nr:hypothetical protein AX758_12325 [Enterococcus mundtii]